MVKTTLALAVILLLTACGKSEPYTTDKTSFNTGLQTSTETSDCKAYKIYDDNSCACNYVVMIRCPNSSVTTKTNEKHPKTTVAISK